LLADKISHTDPGFFFDKPQVFINLIWEFDGKNFHCIYILVKMYIFVKRQILAFVVELLFNVNK